MRIRLAWFALMVVLTLAGSTTWAQSTVRVALAGAEPFVSVAAEKPAGFSVDLWESVAAANGWKFAYEHFPTVDEGLRAVESGRCDVLVGNTSITSEREKRVEFSQPFYRAGLQIMVSERRSGAGRVLGRLAEPQHLPVLGFVAVAVVLSTFAVAWFERRHNPEFPKTGPAGLAEAFYYVMGLVTGKSAYKGFPGVLGRLVLVAWMLASLFVVSYVTGVLASAMTVDGLRGHIAGPEDLPGHFVGLVAGTESEDYARERNLDYAAYPTIEAAVGDLVKGRVQAVLGDAPVLQYFDYMHPRVPVHEVGPVFQAVNYGFAVPVDSPLRGPINLALLHLAETGDFDLLGRNYFGASYLR